MNTEQQFLELPKEAIDSPVKNQKIPNKKPLSAIFVDFRSKWETLPAVEDKLKASVDFMRSTLAQTGSPSFKDFWEVRKLSLFLFKENINPILRSQFWAEFSELSAEARRLKEILDEQSSFAAEQIHLAIQAMEFDVENYQSLLPQIELPAFPVHSKIFLEKKDFYFSLQQELELLNHLASRINSLRKETVKIEMRIRQKNQFFERLSLIGDKVFPKRKELIKNLSEAFLLDVEDFITRNFTDFPENRIPVYVLREEIKSLQEIAKILTLNTHCFTQTRIKLSECWDQIKLFEKERKKEVIQKKMVSRQNYDQVMEHIKELTAYCLNEDACSVEESKKSEEIITLMRGLDLGRDEVRSLKQELQDAKKPILDRIESKRLERENEQKQAEKLQREKITALKKNMEELLADGMGWDIEKVVQLRLQYQNELDDLPIHKSEKFQFDRLFKQIKDLISEKKEKALLNLSQDELAALDQLGEVLQQKKQRRLEMKQQLENYRKSLGNSGLDFEKAMLLRELIDEEKGSLDKINQSISEIEEKIQELEGR